MAHGTLLSLVWQPGGEGRLGENGYMYMLAESLCCLLETITTYFVNCLSVQFSSVQSLSRV